MVGCGVVWCGVCEHKRPSGNECQWQAMKPQRLRGGFKQNRFSFFSKTLFGGVTEMLAVKLAVKAPWDDPAISLSLSLSLETPFHSTEQPCRQVALRKCGELWSRVYSTVATGNRAQPLPVV